MERRSIVLGRLDSPCLKADATVQRVQRTVSADPGENESRPKVPSGGKRENRKVVDDRDD